MMRREYYRTGWFIHSAGKLWDNWMYDSEAAAKTTAERCNVPNATVVEGRRQGVVNDRGQQYSEKQLYDRNRH